MKNMQIKYPNKLKEYRIKNNLTQRQVSSYLSLNSEDRISRWEQGQAVPGLPNLFKLCVLYQVSPFELYSDLAYTTECEVETKKLSGVIK